MIGIQLKEGDKFAVTIPKEVNSFLFRVSNLVQEGVITGIEGIPYFSDHGEIVVIPNDFNSLYNNFKSLEENLNKIVEHVPLPDMVGREDGVLHIGYKTLMDFDNFVELGTGGGKYFDKNDMIYLIGLIKEKILEAKEKNEALIFSGD